MQLKFRKKPVVIEAFKMTEERRRTSRDWPEWLHRAWNQDARYEGALFPTDPTVADGTFSIRSKEGVMLVSWGDWIIRGVQGELYPCKPEIFEATYEPA